MSRLRLRDPSLLPSSLLRSSFFLLPCLPPYSNRQPVFARHANTELRWEAIVEGDEIVAQRDGVGPRRGWLQAIAWDRNLSRTCPRPPRRSARGSRTPPSRTGAGTRSQAALGMRSVRPHSNGDRGAGLGGGGMYRFITSNILNRLLSDSQVVRAIRPPLRQTRASSPAAASGRLANMTPHVDTTASNAPCVEGKLSASPSW